MSRFVRASKVRHVFCKPPKDDKNYKGFRLSSAQGDHNYIKASDRSFAIPIAQANGSLCVLQYDMKDRRLPAGVLPTLDGHRGPVLDFDFNPFVSKLIATGGDDCVTKIWGIPPEGLTESISEALVSLAGHDKKVSVVLHHPTAEFVLATGSADKTVKLWDVNEQAEMGSIDHDEILQGMAWDSTGELLATSCRDKHLRLIDPRKGAAVHTVKAHDGQRTMKVVFCPNNGPGNNEVICTVGFTRQAKRQFRLWDQRDMTKPYATCNIDQSAGALLPFYDDANKILYLAGKGDANIRYYELVSGSPWQFFIEEYRSNAPCRGMCMVPTRILDTKRNEIARFLKLQKDKVTPLSFICPRKADMFQADLFPDAYAGKPSLKAEEFYAGKKGKVITVPMDPSKRTTGGGGGNNAKTTFKKKKTAAVLQKELDAANKTIARYEELLKKHKIKF